LKEKKLPILDKTGFFFCIHTQVKALLPIKIEKDEKRRQEEEARAKYEKWLERKVSLNIFRQHIWAI
jgi:hypothetical protein